MVEVRILGDFIVNLGKRRVVAADMAASPVEEFRLLVAWFRGDEFLQRFRSRSHVTVLHHFLDLL